MPASAPAGLLVVRPAELTRHQLSRVADVYEQAFPAELRVPFEDLAAENPAGLLLVAIDVGADVAEPVGFAAMMRLGVAGWTFLRYYGIAAGRRRQGIGLTFWRLLQPALADACWPGRTVLEVEHPGQPDIDPAEQQVRLQRIAFWQGCGALLLPVDGYVMPDITGLAAPEPMLLMTYDPARTADMAPDEVGALVTALYAERYGLDADHPLVAAALASLGPRDDG
jgi:hypothetical protein